MSATATSTTGSADPGAALRADIRRLGTLLGETIERQEGPDLLALVEEVRALVRSDPKAAADLLAKQDLETAVRLARAFGTYFHLANITEQVHRVRTLTESRLSEGGWLSRAVDRVIDEAVNREDVRHVAAGLRVRPVLTAHPTEAARRSILTKLRRVASLLDEPPGPRSDRGLAEVIDLIWQTDELRIARPDPMDEARNAMYYLDELFRSAVPEVLGDLKDELA